MCACWWVQDEDGSLLRVMGAATRFYLSPTNREVEICEVTPHLLRGMHVRFGPCFDGRRLAVGDALLFEACYLNVPSDRSERERVTYLAPSEFARYAPLHVARNCMTGPLDRCADEATGWCSVE